jgi:hypothetical protein
MSISAMIELWAYDIASAMLGEDKYDLKEGERWITLENGKKVAIKKATGEVVAGLPDKYIGKHIDEAVSILERRYKIKEKNRREAAGRETTEMPHRSFSMNKFIKHDKDVGGARRYLNALMLKYHFTDKDGEILRLTKDGNGKLTYDFNWKKRVILPRLAQIIRNGKKSFEPPSHPRTDYTEFAVYRAKISVQVYENNYNGKTKRRVFKCTLKAGRTKKKGLTPYYLVVDKKKELMSPVQCADEKDLSFLFSGAQSVDCKIQSPCSEQFKPLSYDERLTDFLEIVNLEIEELL